MARVAGSAFIFAFFLASMAAIQCASGEIICENLPDDICAFAISSSGTRCVLERYMQGAVVKFQCRASQVKADNLAGWIETDECIQACGVDRRWAGISSEPLLDARFLDKLCAAPCYMECPNIVDLYFNMAAAEGVYLPKLCEDKKSNPRRGMAETLIRSSGFSGTDATAPASELAPTPSP